MHTQSISLISSAFDEVIEKEGRSTSPDFNSLDFIIKYRKVFLVHKTLNSAVNDPVQYDRV